MLHEFYTKLFTKDNRWQLWFWAIVFLEAPLSSALGNNGQTLQEAIIFRLIGLIAKMMAAYLLTYFLMDKLLFRKKYFLFVLSLPVAAYLIAVIGRFLNIYIGEALLYPDIPNENLWEIISRPSETLGIYLFRFTPFAFWFAFIKIGIDQLRSNQQIAELGKEKTAAELSLLKAQIHPHFLFNTLNNLYTLTLEKSDKAPEVVEKLSAMLDYLLYRCNEKKVTVQQEVELIQNYLSLESLRYGDKLNLTFEHQIDTPSTALVAPLILISPVENAFKHGASGNTDKPTIRIKLSVDNGELQFEVWNNKPAEAPTDDREYTAGIGLTNVRRQLNLLYPDRHTLLIEEDKLAFSVVLTIKL